MDAGLVAGVVAIGLVHGLLPDHGWPIAATYALARRRRWLHGTVAALVIGVGHLVSSVALVAAYYWVSGFAAFAEGPWLRYVAGVVLVGLGVYEYRHGHGHDPTATGGGPVHAHGPSADHQHGPGHAVCHGYAPDGGHRHRDRGSAIDGRRGRPGSTTAGRGRAKPRTPVPPGPDRSGSGHGHGVAGPAHSHELGDHPEHARSDDDQGHSHEAHRHDHETGDGDEAGLAALRGRLPGRGGHRHLDDEHAQRGLYALGAAALLLGFAHEEPVQILAICVGTDRCLELMVVYSTAVIAAILAPTLLLVYGYRRHRDTVERYTPYFPVVTAAVLVGMGLGFIAGVL
jgi:ABC-type nickel/cobalt efflux system permease component RcnA